MITNLFIETLYLLVLLILKLVSKFGDVTSDGNLATAITNMKALYLSMGDFWPIGVLVLIIAFDVGFELSVAGYKFLKWAYQKIPGIN